MTAPRRTLSNLLPAPAGLVRAPAVMTNETPSDNPLTLPASRTPSPLANLCTPNPTPIPTSPLPLPLPILHPHPVRLPIRTASTGPASGAGPIRAPGVG